MLVAYSFAGHLLPNRLLTKNELHLNEEAGAKESEAEEEKRKRVSEERKRERESNFERKKKAATSDETSH